MVVRALLRSQLEAEGCAVVEAADGRAAVARAREHQPDLALLDIEMPVLDGLGVLAALRDDPELAGVPVIFITSRTDTADVVAALEAGAHDYLRKPFEPAELIARVRAALRVKAMHDELAAARAQLARLVTTDPLTGLPDRRSLHEQAERLCSRSARHRRELAVVLVAVDDLEARAAHVRDAVLVAVAARLRERARREDVLGRWAADAFVVLAPDTGIGGAAALAEDARAAVVRQPVRVDGEPVELRASAGWAVWRGDTVHELTGRAQDALATARAEGGTARGD